MKKSTKYGIIGSAISCVILFLLLWFIVLPVLKDPDKEDEGLMVSFGETPDGSGMTQMPTPTQASEAAGPATALPASRPQKQELMTQTDNSLAIAEQKQKAKDRREQEAINRQQREAVRRAGEQRRREQGAIAKANSMNGLFGNNNSSGSGSGTGDTRQGNPAGHGSSGGNSWSLNGRSLTGRLVTPSYDQDVEGKITVNIRVDRSGRVSSASIGSPTTISDSRTRNAALSAARNTHFSSGKGVSSGSISYNFNLR